MIRFFMSMQEAVNLVIKAASIAKGKDIFILKMNKIRIIDLAEVMIEKIAPKYGYLPQEIEIKRIGTRPGEKLEEQLITTEEKEHVIDLGELSVILPQISLPFRKNITLLNKKIKTKINNGHLLSKDEIRTMIGQYIVN